MNAGNAARQRTTQLGQDLDTIGTQLNRSTAVTGLFGVQAAENDQVADRRRAALAQLEIVRTINREIVASQNNGGQATEEQLNRLRAALVQLGTAYDRFGQSAQARQPVTGNPIADLTGVNVVNPATSTHAEITTADVIRQASERINAIRTQTQIQREAQEAATLAGRNAEEATTRLQALQRSLAAIPGVAAEAAAEAARSIALVGTSINTLAERIERLATAIERMRANPVQAGPLPGLRGVNQNQFEVPEFPGFAEGGFVPGQGRGDIIPAMLEPGEFIWDRDTTQRFFPIIHSLHANGSMPQGYQRGGAVTNVGDVNITVTGGGSTEQTARDLVNRVRREIRRGSINPEDLN